MLKAFLVIITLTFISNHSLSQNYSWITPNKPYLKMYIADDGIYRIAKSDFTSAGINTAAVDPRTIKVYNKGVQISIFFQGEQDGSFDEADYLDFYGIRNYGGLTNTFTEENIIAYVTDEYFNQYSDTNSYWIDWGGANGLRMQNSNFSAGSPYPQPYFFEKIHLEKDKIYWIGEYKDGNDFRDFTNEKFLGESWYWSLLGSTQSVTDTFSIPLLYSTPQNASVRIFAYPQNISTGILNEHTLQIKINNTVVASINRNDYSKIDTVVTFSSSLLSGTSVNTAAATYTSNGGFDGYMFFDLFEVQYPKLFKFRNSRASFTLTGTDTTSVKISLSNYDGSGIVNIYDVTRGIKINNFTASADTLIFSGKRNSKFEVVNQNITNKPIRIIQKQVPNYVSNVNGADYLLIYNSLFTSQATQLKNYRESKDNFRVIKAELTDIYDIFNYGLEDPVAIRNFVRHAYANWEIPKLKYLCLFGRGSLDPKKNSPSTVFEKNLIPLKGHPSSDNYFSNINNGGFTFYNHVSIGRLPAYTTSEAQSMVDNIITYESQPPSDWWKSFTFISGGTSAPEQELLLPLNNDTLINPYIIPKPLSANPVRIFRNDLNGAQTYNYSDSIKNQINSGTVTVNFMGHAGSQDWEIGMTDPNVLSNYDGKFPLVFSMTCYTGKVGDPNSRQFGEKFMNMTNRGAIGFVGTSGWGFVYSQLTLNRWLYYGIAKDTIRRIGDAFSYAMNKIKGDSIYFTSRHTINCYTLQGDPAAKLVLPKVPEYVIKNSDYRFSNNLPSVGEPLSLTIYPKNYGLHSDSCNIRIDVSSRFKKILTKDTTLRNFKFADSIRYNLKFDEPGDYYFNVSLDYLNRNPNENKSNNIITFNLSTNNYGFVRLKPVNNSVIKTDSVEFVGLNPYLNSASNSIRVLLEFDTTKNFNSQLKQTFVNNSISGVATKFKASIPRLDSNVLYYWRTNAIVNNDSNGWSSYFTFRYNPVFTDEKDIMSSDTNAVVYKNKNSQYFEGDFNNTYFGTSGIKLSEFTGNLYVRSMGSSGAEASYFSVLDKSIHIDAGSNPGLNLLKVRKLDGVILQFRNFRMISSSSNDSVLNFLNTFDGTHYLLGMNSAFVGGTELLNAAIISKFNQFGSTQIHLFRVGFFDTWSFIGYLNAPPSDVCEDLHRYVNAWIPSVCSQTKIFIRHSGSVSNIVGPSNKWKDFSWQNTLLPGSSLRFDVYGIDKNEVQTLLISNLISNGYVDLNGINTFQYPKLNLVANLRIDTLAGLQSPLLNAVKVNYIPPPEIVENLNSYWQSDTSLNVGQSLNFRFKYSNTGNVSVPGVIIKIYKTFPSSANLIRSDTVNTPLKVDSTYEYSTNFIVPNVRLIGSNKSQFIVEVYPKGLNNEFFTFNNFNTIYLKVNTAVHTANISLFNNEKLIQSGDFVPMKPDLRLSLGNLKNELLLISDTTQVALILNNNYVPYFNNGSINEIMKITNEGINGGSNQNNLSILFKPLLNEGKNNLKIIYKNPEDNFDSTEYDVFVSNELLVKDFYNYPNPTKGETNFIFNLMGSEVPFKCLIKIYTVSGRLIKEINSTPVLGYNQIAWDGRDSDGDLIANGTYLYKFVAEDNTRSETAIQKLVMLR
ncbi:MAG: C25 family cysteine peptidase [Bacteroidota bacterium]|nr:C25 family cysteine peptidase [Bacteroidota bacterium]